MHHNSFFSDTELILTDWVFSVFNFNCRDATYVCVWCQFHTNKTKIFKLLWSSKGITMAFTGFNVHDMYCEHPWVLLDVATLTMCGQITVLMPLLFSVITWQFLEKFTSLNVWKQLWKHSLFMSCNACLQSSLLLTTFKCFETQFNYLTIQLFLFIVINYFKIFILFKIILLFNELFKKNKSTYDHVV